MARKDSLQAVLTGCGGISGAWLNPVSTFDDIEIVGLVDLDLGNAKAAKDKFGLENAICGTDLAQVLEQTTPDVVFDVTVPEAHCQVTLTALEYGCHVLGEKPLATNMSDARKMVDAAEENGKTYAVIQNRRYNDNIIRYRNAVQSPDLGDLTTLNADFYLGPHFGGFRAAMQNVLLRDMAIHSFDQARFISGKDPVSVYCHEWNPKGSWYTHGASAVAIFEMTDDVVFTYRGSWCAQGLQTAWECDWRAIGTNGTATWDGAETIRCEVVDPDSEDFFRKTVQPNLPEHTPLKYTSHAGVIREFVDSIKSGGTPQTVCTDNIRSLAMVDAAIESAAAGKKIEIAI